MKAIFVIIVTLFTINMLNAQIFGRIMDRAKDKIVDKVEDKVVERISEEIARAAMKPIDKALDDMLRERFEQDSINGKTDRNYGDFVTAFMQPIDLPATYTFDMVLEAETKDYDGDKNKMDMMLTKDGSAIGIVQNEDGKKSMMVFDLKNDIMAIYSEENGEKKVYAMTSLLSLTGAAMLTADNEEDEFEIIVEKTGKTKKIAGYQTDEWKIEDTETKSKVYVATDFPISWKESYGPFLKQVLPTTRRDQMPQGMVLKSESKTKKKNKKSKFEVKKVIDAPTSITNSEYNQEKYQAEE